MDQKAQETLQRLHEECLNLKAMLMELGNRLVKEHGFAPAQAAFDSQRDARFLRSTQLIAVFVAWLNHVPEAQKILAELGLEWPLGQVRGNAKGDNVAIS